MFKTKTLFSYLILLLSFNVFAATTISITCDVPTTRENGDPFDAADVDYYEMRIMLGPVEISTEQGPTCDLTSAGITKPGSYDVSVRIADTYELISEYTTSLIKTITVTSPPSAPGGLAASATITVVGGVAAIIIVGT